MRIKRIEYENFRNFKDHGEIICSTDGKVTIIYGKNGDGKTTLHQLFQWIIYGEVNFNKTTSNKLYNLKMERDVSYGETFEVLGRIDFQHDGEEYSATRRYTYRKKLSDSEKIAEEFTLSKMNDDNDWKPLNQPSKAIEKLLPPGLSEYFFFDGESMIADLRVKGRDSAGKLKKALYSMFELDALDSAVKHIGDVDKKSTVLGKLYLNKGTISSGGEISALKHTIEDAQNKIDGVESRIEKLNAEKKNCKDVITDVSERIGEIKTKAEYEHQRKMLKDQIEEMQRNINIAQADFGLRVIERFPKFLVAKRVEIAKSKVHLEVEKNTFPTGLNKELIYYLLSGKTDHCICGHELGYEEVEKIKSYISLFPPFTYTELYNGFNAKAKEWAEGYSVEELETQIERVLNNQERIEKYDEEIDALDETEKNSPDVEELVVARKEAEEKMEELDKEINKKSVELNNYRLYLKKKMRDFDKLTQETAAGERMERKIHIMKKVAEYFTNKLDEESRRYSERLQHNIQSLIDNMLTSRRKVSVSPEFAVRVTDSFDDESKSEGQFAVVSFAYIGGVLRMLQSEQRLSQKEYPLILDGPFSKLDPEQRKNVVEALPGFAPQVIIFSKDELNDVFKQQDIGRVWTITSNEEKNVAKIKEGFLW